MKWLGIGGSVLLVSLSLVKCNVDPCKVAPELCIQPSPATSPTPMPSVTPSIPPTPPTTQTEEPPATVPTPVPVVTPPPPVTPPPVTVPPGEVTEGCVVYKPTEPKAPGKLWNKGCPKGFEAVPGYQVCMAKSSCTHPDDSNQCWDVPGYDVNKPDLQYGCFNCAAFTLYNLSSGYRKVGEDGYLVVGPKYKKNPGKGLPGPQDAYCRVLQPDGTWKDKGNVCPPCGYLTTPPSPGSSPPPVIPPTEFNCNGEWNAPSCDMKISRISMSVFYIQGRPGCMADQKCPAKVGEKIFFNSTPRYTDSRCVRGAAIPNNCVVLPQFANQTVWTGATADGGENSLGYLASWKADESGSHPVQVCVGANCAAITVYVR